MRVGGAGGGGRRDDNWCVRSHALVRGSSQQEAGKEERRLPEISGLGAIGLPVGMLMRFIPVKEDPESFFDNTDTIIVTGSSSNSIVEAGGEEGVELMRGDEGNITV